MDFLISTNAHELLELEGRTRWLQGFGAVFEIEEELVRVEVNVRHP